MPRSLPWMKWHVSDWLGDEALSRCSPATRGIWADAISQMHKRGRTGVLRDTAEALAQLCRCKPEDMRKALAELRSKKAANVTFNRGVWTLVNRRMKREADTRNAAADRVKKHRKSRALSECNADGDSTARQRKPLPGFEDAGLPTAETEICNGPETPERLRVKELTPLARYSDSDLPDLFCFAAEVAGFDDGQAGIEKALRDHNFETVIHALEARAEIGSHAFRGLASQTAGLIADCRRKAVPREHSAFERWRRLRREKASRAQRVELARSFVRRPKAERAALLQALGVENEALAEFSSQYLDVEVRTGGPLVEIAARAEELALQSAVEERAT